VKAKTTGSGRQAAAKTSSRAAGKSSALETVGGLTKSLRSLAGQVVGMAGVAVDTSLAAATGLFPQGVASTKALVKAGAFLHDMREAAGIPLEDLGKAIDLKDPSLLELAENGKMALPFEVILRLASVLARNDPVPFVMNLTKAYSPGLWKVLESLGIGRVIEHAGREHEFISIYRARDEARTLTDEEFSRVRKFVETAFDMALEFNREAKAAAERKATPKAATPRAAPRRAPKASASASEGE
jgi:transcriptional regulator with XRE-family HTH domain